MHLQNILENQTLPKPWAFDQKPGRPGSKPLKVFELFPTLPTEIRRMIWAMALEEPRVVHMIPRTVRPSSKTFVDILSPSDDLQTSLWMPRPKSVTPENPFTQTYPPPLMITCKESHDVANFYYTNILPPSLPQNSGLFGFDFNHDTMYINDELLIPHTMALVYEYENPLFRSTKHYHESFFRVQHMALHLSYRQFNDGLFPSLAHAFPNLQTLSFIRHELFDEDRKPNYLSLMDPSDFPTPPTLELALTLRCTSTQFIFPPILASADLYLWNAREYLTQFIIEHERTIFPEEQIWRLPKMRNRIVLTEKRKESWKISGDCGGLLIRH